MTDTMYHSTQSVPQRVDVAFRRGYGAGLKDARRLVGVMLVVTLFAELRRRNFPILPCCLVALAFAMAIVPALVLAVVIRSAWRTYRRRAGVRAATQASPTVTRSTTGEDAPF